MARECCAASPVSRRFNWRLSTAAASILPTVVLFLLPKCPLCFAVLLTVLTGVGFSASGAARLRGTLVVFSVVTIGLAVAEVLRHHASGVRRTP